jgi:hypothetical protein
MAFSGATELQFVLLVLAVWACLTDTPFNQKNTLFARFFPSLEDLENIASAASIVFARCLFEVLMATTPPTIQFFKSLPSDTSSC